LRAVCARLQSISLYPAKQSKLSGQTPIIKEHIMSKPARQTIKLKDSERQPCEIWTRVMGYHRPVSSFNIGKKGEHQERCYMKERH
jgi:hypothetical protein